MLQFPCTLHISLLQQLLKVVSSLSELALVHKYAKYKQRCHSSNVEFVALAWESLGGATPEVHDLINKLSDLEADRFHLKRNIVCQVSLLCSPLSESPEEPGQDGPSSDGNSRVELCRLLLGIIRNTRIII